MLTGRSYLTGPGGEDGRLLISRRALKSLAVMAARRSRGVLRAYAPGVGRGRGGIDISCRIVVGPLTRPAHAAAEARAEISRAVAAATGIRVAGVRLNVERALQMQAADSRS